MRNDFMTQNEIVLNTLLKAGWFIERKIDRKYITASLINADYPLLNSAIEFLENFGDLTIYFKNLKNAIEKDDINFDIKHALALESSEYVLEKYVPRVQKQLCILGSAYRDHFSLLMSDDGNVYGGYDYFLCKIADTGIKAIEAIILGYEFEEIK